jgi:site-specific recombinase XerD
MLAQFRQIQTDFFQELKRRGRSENTIKNYRTDLECFNQFLGQQNDQLDLNNFSLREVNGYDQFLHGKYNSDNSRRRRIQTLRLFFDYLLENSFIGSNPVRELGTSPKFLDIPRPALLIDIKTLWTHLLTQKPSDNQLDQLILERNQLLLCLIFGAGLTVSDLANLRVQDFLQSKDGRRVLITRERRDPYTIPLPSIFNKLIPKYLELLDKKKTDYGLAFDQFFFNANPHRILAGGLSPRGIELLLEEYRRQLKIELTAKNIRQACIFCWMCEGKRDGQIKEWLGVAPSYSLKMYRDFQQEHLYNNTFLEDLYSAYIYHH